jgi:hypothetical protein
MIAPASSAIIMKKELIMNILSFTKRAFIVAGAAAILAGCGNGASAPFAPSANVLAGRTPLAGDSCPSPGPQRSRAPEIINLFATLPTSQQASDFEIVLCGNWTDQIGSQPLYGPYDPFCPPSHGPSNPCYPTVSYNATNNTTTVSFAGSALYQNIPGHSGLYHFGLLWTWYKLNLNDEILASYWTYDSHPPMPQPMVSVNWSPKTMTCKDWKYATVYVAVSTSKGGSAQTGQWMETAYCPKTGQKQPVFTFQNFGTKTLYVVSSGVVLDQPVPTDPTCYTTDAACAQDMNILGTLNFAGMPPPGYSGSPFVKLLKPPSILKPVPFP